MAAWNEPHNVLVKDIFGIFGATIRLMDTQLVYFIRATESGRIKIGIAKDPTRRLMTLQIGCPEPLILLGAVEGGRRMEMRLHADLHHDRIRGEWFRDTDHVIRVIGDALGWGVPSPQQAESARKAEALRKVLG